MIDISTLEVSGFKGAILGMRNAFKSRPKSDSGFRSLFSGNFVNDIGETLDPNFVNDNLKYSCSPVAIGPEDLKLAQKLLRSGTDDHSKFMRMIHVQADINAPLYWWKEMDTYKVATVANSESTMHTIHSREITMDDFSNDYLNYDEVTVEWDGQCYIDSTYDCLYDVIGMLNECRERYLKAVKRNDSEAHKIWYQLIQLLPSSYMQMRTWDADYQTLRRIYFARKDHRLKEWSGENGFCEWIKTLPYSEELITYG